MRPVTAERTAAAPKTARSKVLVVDGDPEGRRVCQRLAGKAGYDAQCVTSAEAAYVRLREGWDVVLVNLDLRGPLGGMDVLRRARRNSAADVIVYTGRPRLDSAVQALREGAYDYLPKPITPLALTVALDRCLEKRRLSRELRHEQSLRTELAELDHLKDLFGQFVTPEVARFVLDRPEEVWRKGERRDVSVLFMDVRGFTPYAEAVEPEEAVNALNEIFAGVVKAVQAEGGVTNKFLGDGLLAVFGAPVPDRHHPAHAVRAALRARDVVEKVAARRARAGKQALRIGIGVNTGEAMAACLGGEGRAEYSVIGHVVNMASRLEGEAIPGQILIGPDTLARLPPTFRLGLRIPFVLPGISVPVIATEVLDEHARPATTEK